MDRYFNRRQPSEFTSRAELIPVWRPQPGKRFLVVHLSETWEAVDVHWVRHLNGGRGRNVLCLGDSLCPYCGEGVSSQMQGWAVVAPSDDFRKTRLLQFASVAAMQLLAERDGQRDVAGLLGVYSRLGTTKNSPLTFEPIREVPISGAQTFTTQRLRELVVKLYCQEAVADLKKMKRENPMAAGSDVDKALDKVGRMPHN